MKFKFNEKERKLRSIRIISAIIVILFSMLFLATFSVVLWPKILINNTTLRWATLYLEKKGIHLTWDKLDLQIQSASLLRKGLRFNFDQLCFDAPAQGASGCTPKVDIGFEVDFSGITPKLTQIGPMEIHKLDWTYLPPASGDSKPSKEAQKLHGVISLTAKDSGKNKGAQKGVVSYAGLGLDLLGFADLPDQARVDLKAQLTLNEKVETSPQIKYTAEAKYQKDKAKLTLIAHGLAAQDHITSEFSGSVLGFVESLPPVDLKDCQLDLKQTESRAFEKPGHLNFSCPIQVHAPLSPANLKKYQIPAQAGILAKANLDLSKFIPDADTRFKGDVEVELKPVLHRLFRGDAKIVTQLDVVPSEVMDKWDLKAKFDTNVNIPNFGKFVAFVNQTPWVIPAPFHVLKGKADFNVHGKSTLTQGELPFVLTTRMQSVQQHFDLDGTGAFRFQKQNEKFSPALDLDLTLSRVQLELPKLDLAAPPRFVPDSRIKVASVEKENQAEKGSDRITVSKAAPIPRSIHKEPESSFKYKIFIHTPPETPIQIISNFSKDKIPVHVSAVLTDSAPPAGQVKVGEFPVEFFRRKAQVKEFLLNLRSPTGESSVAGTVHVNYADYKVTIEIKNTIDKPLIHFKSDPPLAEDQIISVLIFGQPLQDLDTGEGDSVGAVRSAFADGAVNLLSFYVLASTPIQSVGYDSAAGEVSAKLRLAQGTSLNLGAGADSTSVGIRKRLGGSWTISTTMTHNTSTGTNTPSGNLEWRHRY